MCDSSSADEPCGARPLIFRTEHDRLLLRRIRIRGDPVFEKHAARFLDFDVANQRGHDRFIYTLGAHLLYDFGNQLRKYQRRRDDGVPVAEDKRVDAGILETQPNRVPVSRGRLATRDINRIPGRTEWRNELAE